MRYLQCSINTLKMNTTQSSSSIHFISFYHCKESSGVCRSEWWLENGGVCRLEWWLENSGVCRSVWWLENRGT